MEKLLAYLKSLPVAERDAFAGRCGTTVGYLRKAASVGQKMSEGLCIRVGIESHGAVMPEDLRPDVDWEYMRAAMTTPAVEATPSDALRAGVVRRHDHRRAEDVPTDLDHLDRRHVGPPIQCPVAEPVHGSE